jgi:hypothetical protein
MAMRKGNWFIILGILVMAGCMTASQLAKLPLHSIDGVVTDYNGKPVEGALITTTPPSSSVLTNSDGKYAIRKLPTGEFTVHVSKPGYAEESVTLAVGGYDYPTKGDIQLLLQSMVVQEPVEETTSYSNQAEESEVKKETKEKEAKETKGTTGKKKKKWWEK